MSKIILRKIKKGYDINGMHYPILKNISLSFESGKTYAILGKSGCGKSTLLNLMAGRDQNYEGDIFYNGINIKELDETSIKNYFNHEVVLIEQIPILFEHLTLKDNINLPLNITQTSNIHDTELLSFTSLNKKVNKLSGGEKQRVNIVTSTNVKPKIILADEPTGSLDYETSITVMENLKKYAKNSIFLFVTHNESLAEKYADEILYMKDGKISKNYSSLPKTSPQAFPITTKKIAFKASIKTAIKLMMGEKRKTSLFLSSFITALLCVGFCVTMSYGFLKFFKEQNIISYDSNINIKQAENYGNLTHHEIENLKSISPEIVLGKHFYYDEEYIECYLNEEPIILDIELFTKPPILIETELKNNQIILGAGEVIMNEYETLLGVDDLEEYLKNEMLMLDVPIGEDFYSFEVVDFLLLENDSLFLYHSNSKLNELLFDTAYVDIVLNDSIPDDLIKYIINSPTLNYKNNNYMELYSSNGQLLIFNELKSYENLVPIFEADEAFWIKHYQSLFYFENLSLNELSFDNELVYFEFSNNDLKYGRYPENNNELVISSALYDYLFTDYHLPRNLACSYQGINFSLKIVGIIEDDSFFIHQSPSWSWQFYNEIVNDLYKPINYLIVSTPEESINIIKELESKYPNLNIQCQSSDLYNIVDDVLDKLIIGFSILNGIMLVISLFSIIVIGLLEINEYSKHIKKLKYYGWTLKDNFSIWRNLYILRALITSCIGTILCYTMCFYLNNILNILFDLGNNLFYVNYQMPLVLFLTCIFIVLISLIIIKNKVKQVYTQTR